MFNIGADFDHIFYSSPQPLFVFDAETLRIVNVNEAACEHYGYAREEFTQLTIKDIRPDSEQKKLSRTLDGLTGATTTRRPFSHLKKDGTIIYVEVLSYKVIFDSRAARLVVPIDVTEQLTNKAKLEAALEKMEHTLESISDGHFSLSPDGTVTYWNKSAEALTGVVKADIMNKVFWEVVPEAINSGFINQVERALASGAVMKFEEYFSKTNRWFYTSVYPEPDGVAIYFQDITELKRHQQELRLKNQHLKEMAYFNSHEVRRPLANIMGLYHLLTSVPDVSAAEKEEIITKIQLSCEDIDKVIKRIDQTHFTKNNFFTAV